MTAFSNLGANLQLSTQTDDSISQHIVYNLADSTHAVYPADSFQLQSAAAAFSSVTPFREVTFPALFDPILINNLPGCIQTIPSDGNCLFHALSFAICGNFSLTSKVRKVDCDRMQEMNFQPEQIVGRRGTY